MLHAGVKLLDIKAGPGDSKYVADVLIDGIVYKNVKFGSKRYQHYKDRTPLKLYSHLDHNDKERLRLFYARHRNNNGPAAMLSKKYLW